MALNYLWIAFFLIAFVIGLFKLIFLGDTQIFPALMQSTFDMSKTGFELSIGLTGVLTLWLGLMKIGENAGIVRILARAIGPLLNKLFPELEKDHPAFGSIIMNIAANMLGLDNAATPMGLKAMQQMQDSNPQKERATNAMIMFLVLNTSGLTLIPISIMVYRAQMGAADPSSIFIPILLATYFSTIAGLIAVSIYQKINLLDKMIIAYLGGLTAIIATFIWFLSGLTQEQIALVSTVSSNVILFSIIVGFISLAAIKKINVYESFIEGAKEGFQIAIKIIPFLVGILVAIGVFRTSGAMEYVVSAIAFVVEFFGINSDFVPALPTALMKPLSGSAARGMMVETMNSYGVDSFPALVASTVQGVTDTTFYVIAVYFGSVGIKHTRHAVGCGLIADFVGIIAAILIAYLFFYQF